MTTYQLTLTKKQAQTIQAACELYERLHAGQWFALEDVLPLKDGIYWHNLEYPFKNMIEPYCDTNKMKFERVAGDITRVIRHHLAWEAHPEGGDTVNFRTPLKMGSEPLAKMQVINDISPLSDVNQIMMINCVRYSLNQHINILVDGKHPNIIAAHICDLKTSWGQLSDVTKSIIKSDITQHINDIQDKLKDDGLFGPYKSVLHIVLEYWQDLHNWMNANA